MNLPFVIKLLFVVICALASMIVGIGAGWLSHRPGARKRDAVLIGGGTFGGTLTLCILVLTSLGVL
ncbi:hypothetical protein AB0K74_07560 [Streptomyces sp. NPDC056159]|uniref:hypothetical protein n=1 Tax=Streptomyces sp. NPDC056159 TaxID=3155537 RepID=UPI0034481608